MTNPLSAHRNGILERMPVLNTRHRQPLAALFYTSLGAFVAAIGMVYLGIILVSSHALDGTLPPGLSATLVIAIVVVALVTIAYPVLHYALLSYEVGEHALSVYSGVIFRQHETINFSRIQSIENERDPILALFGLTHMEVWTASPNQHASSPAARPHPETTLYLSREMANELKNFMLLRPTNLGI